MDKVLLASPDLPDTLVPLVPVLTQPVEQALEILPQVVRDGVKTVIDVDGVHHLSVDIELFLGIGAITDANRPAAMIAIQVIEPALGKYLFTIDAIQRLQHPTLFQLMA